MKCGTQLERSMGDRRRSTDLHPKGMVCISVATRQQTVAFFERRERRGAQGATPSRTEAHRRQPARDNQRETEVIWRGGTDSRREEEGNGAGCKGMTGESGFGNKMLVSTFGWENLSPCKTMGGKR